MENKDKMEFNKDKMDKIISEYLGLSSEYLKHIDITELKQNIITIIEKYINDKRDIGYILEDDIRYVGNNKVLEVINGITVYENLMEKYVIEGLDMDFTTFEDALRMLRKVLHDESNYHYSINKDNAYTLYKVVYDEEYDINEWHDLKPTITVKEYYDMSYDEKEEFFKELEG